MEKQGCMEHIMKKVTLESPSDGLEISVLTCGPQEGARGVVQLVHGMCEHKERYIPFMKFLAGEGYASIIHDHRGHGESIRSSEDLGYFYEGGYIALIDDIKAVNSLAGEENPGLPVVLMGHSMGSMAVRSYLKRYEDTIQALQTICFPVSELQRVTTYRTSFYILTGFLYVIQFTNDGFINLFSLMEDAYAPDGWAVHNPEMPILFISGAEDPCMISEHKFRQAVQAIGKAGYTNVRAKLYQGMRHEILNETGKEQVWKDIREFISGNSGRM